MSDTFSLLNALRFSLKSRLKLGKQRASVNSALTIPKEKKRYQSPRYYLSPNEDQQVHLRCGEGLEFSCSGLIADHNTGTLAILQIAKQDYDFARAIRDVVALRHSLLQNQGFIQQTYSVELVFVMDARGEKALAGLSSELQENMKETSYLHAIGINLLRCDSEEPDKAAVRRAFPWLLTDVRRWYQSDDFAKRFLSESQKEVRKLKSLSLDNFRLSDKRKWSKSQGHKLHLIHGHNGTGKSTFSEAYELLVTGKLDRLDDEIDYRTILRHRDSSDTDENSHSPSPAKIEVEFAASEDQETWIVGENGLEPRGESKREFLEIDSGSFRMEQGFADDLVRTGRGIQVGRFLSAFFPDEKEAVARHRDSRAKFYDQWKQLDTRTRLKISEAPTPNPSSVLEKIASCWDSSGAILTDKLLDFSAIPDLRDRFANARSIGIQFTVDENSLVELDEAWMQVTEKASELFHDIEPLLGQLKDIDRWSSQTSIKEGTQKELAELTNQWLEASVLCELLEKEIDVLRVTSAAKEVPELILGGPQHATEENLESQKQQFITQKELRDDLRQQIAQLSFGESNEKRSLTERPSVPASFYENVNKYVTGSSENPADVFRRALSVNPSDVLSFSFEGMPVTVGALGGLTPLIIRLQENRNTATAILSRGTKLNLQGLANDLQRLKTAAEECQTAENFSVEKFKEQLQGPLANALNELTALFTPARWAYRDLKANINDERGETEFQMDGIPADLLLNTAELNTLALVLFFLCAPSGDHPIPLLLLDDPFQNMDELTVTKIARGLKRLMSIWGFDTRLKDWEILILLHGEENLERLRSECTSAVYFLHWLTPSRIGEEENNDDELTRDDDPRSEKRPLEGINKLIVDIS